MGEFAERRPIRVWIVVLVVALLWLTMQVSLSIGWDWLVSEGLSKPVIAGLLGGSLVLEGGVAWLVWRLKGWRFSYRYALAGAYFAATPVWGVLGRAHGQPSDPEFLIFQVCFTTPVAIAVALKITIELRTRPFVAGAAARTAWRRSARSVPS